MPKIYLFLLSVFISIPMAYYSRKNKHIQNIWMVIISIIALCFIFAVSDEYLTLGKKFQIFKILGSEFLIDPVSIIFALMSSGLWVCNNIYSISYFEMNKEINQTRTYFFIALSMIFTFLIAFSKNLFQTFIFYELLTISTYPLVANNLTEHERKSSRFYLLFLLSTSMLLFLPTILYLQNIYGPLDYDKIHNFEIKDIWIIIIMILYGVAKVAIVPVHFWLPKAMVAPIPVSALLHAVAVVKSGLLILIKIYIYIFGIEYLKEAIPKIYGVNIVTILVSISLLISSVLAIYQTTLKKLLAYSTINQLSICLLSLSLFTKLGIVAAILHMISHAIAKIGLFFATGYIYTNSKLTEIDDMSGLAKKMPYTCMLFMINAFSIIGIPILAGFISKAYIMYAALIEPTDYFVLCVLSISILFTANYFVRLLYKFYLKPYKPQEKRVVYAESMSSSMLVAIFIVTFFVCAYSMMYNDIITILNN